MKTITAKIREQRLYPAVAAAGRVYDAATGDVQDYQLHKFNRLWRDIQQRTPFYKQLVQAGTAPAEISNWEDFTRLPVLTRQSIQEDVSAYIDPAQDISSWSVTGGSTGTPFRVPHSVEEFGPLVPLLWLGRSFYGIDIGDRMFHLWGHSHLFGKGWRRHVKQAQRRVKNWLLGYQTFSAYHLTPQRLRDAGQAILRMQPRYMVGYSRSLTLLARENANLAESFHALRLKAIIATTEAFIQPEDAALVEAIFGCPVAMEYGAAETGVMAYTHPADGRYRAFWDTFLLEAVPVNETDAKLLVTSLTRRPMPLIRYDIGDHARNYDSSGHSITGFDAILGRDNDLIDIGRGSFVHPVALAHCVQSQPGVLGMQLIQEKDASTTISIMCETPLDAEGEAFIRRNLATLDEWLSQCKIEYVSQLEQTIAGKTRWVVRR